MGKMTKSPFFEHGERATELLGLIQSDVCGPMTTQAREGYSYFITFIDDLSRLGNVPRWPLLALASRAREQSHEHLHHLNVGAGYGSEFRRMRDP